MAFSVNIEFYRNSNLAEFIIEPKWWKTEELLSSYPFLCEIDHGFRQYYYILSKKQLKKIHEIQLKYLTERTDLADLTISQLEYLFFTSETDFKTIRILIFEWQSDN